MIEIASRIANQWVEAVNNFFRHLCDMYMFCKKLISDTRQNTSESASAAAQLIDMNQLPSASSKLLSLQCIGEPSNHY